jgi:hypothetical protein
MICPVTYAVISISPIKCMVMAMLKKIKATDLLINTENYRFDPVASQKEAIDQMVEDQTNKLFILAEHIVKNGLNPNDRIQVVASGHESAKYNVVEGNRRVVVVKLILNPDLIDQSKYAALKKKFKKLHDDNAGDSLKTIECMVYGSPTEADTWIKLKHAGQADGAGTVSWDAQQILRFEEKVEGKSSIALQAVKILDTSPHTPSEVKKNLPNLKITNLDRLISDPEVRRFLGIQITNGIVQSDIDQKEVVKGLSGVVKTLLNPNFKVQKIYTKEDRKDFIDKFPKTNTPDLSKKATKPWQFNGGTSDQTPNPSPKPKPNPKDRKTLIPKSCTLKISKAKVNNIYHELLKLDINNFTNAGGVLLRVFVELSIDTYIEEHKLTTSPSAAKSNMNFQAKVMQVANHLESKRLADAAICKGIKVSVKNQNDILGIDTWHAYVHNNRFSPTATNLRVTWDALQDFMTILWNNIK